MTVADLMTKLHTYPADAPVYVLVDLGVCEEHGEPQGFGPEDACVEMDEQGNVLVFADEGDDADPWAGWAWLSRERDAGERGH